ncbi:hypothetical protein [Paludibaculum fermentans]|uniref:hypothetical protein n=1 Tax=Paludibaculum fermentans TaxID=1473598 RepID=UPI003EBD61F6
MRFSHVNRRTHLYLAMVLLPWFLMYGVSSLAFNHGEFFEDRDKALGLPLWNQRFERTYAIHVPENGDLRAVGARIMKDNGLTGSFGAYRQGPDQLNVYIYTSLRSTQVKYYIREQRLVAEDRRFRPDHFLTGLHARGGFEQEGFLNKLWGVLVDVVCLGFLLWIATGLYMWWKLTPARSWGWVALAAGLCSFGVFLWRL